MAVDGRIDKIVDNLPVIRPTIMAAAPRIFEKVYNRIVSTAKAGGGVKYQLFTWAVGVGREVSRARQAGRPPGIAVSVQYAIADKLVFSKVRERFGGRLRGCVSGSAPLAPEIAEFFDAAGIPIFEGYGLTETSAAITVNQVKGQKVGTVGSLVPGNSMRIADDKELLVRGGVVFSGYWKNEQATEEAFDDGWFKTGDQGAVDEDGFLTITGRKKELIVTAGGKNVAPAVLEDQLRSHPLISQAMVVGDNKPFIGALIAIDPEAFEGWKQRNSKSAGASVGDLTTDPDLIAEVDSAVKQANKSVSHAESIRKFRILPVDFTEDTGELTPTMKVKRNVVAEKFASDIEAIYDKD
jgi:long-chain acyl-CoA synthetase